MNSTDTCGLEHQAFTTSLRQGVLWVRLDTGRKFTGSDTHTLIDSLNALSPVICPPMLLELNGVLALTRKAQQRFAADLNIAALAFVGPTAVDRTLAAFFTEVHTPPFPSRYFTNPDHALTWLTTNPHTT